jgi:pimeloyl-ACP methyl ester carboxylesterase
LTRFGLMLVACSAVAGAIWAPSGWAWLLSLTPSAALLGGLAAVLAFEFGYARAVSLSFHGSAPSLRTLWSAGWLEVWAMSRLVVWRVPFASARSGRSTDIQVPGQRGLVLVHGYASNRGVWAAWLAQLELQQVPCVAVNLYPTFASISDYSPLIEAAVASMQQRTGLPPVLVGHSMGGLAARAWWATDRSAQRLHRLITIATPHQGTRMAQLGHGLCARQMRPHSDWLAQLQAKQTPAHARRTLCFYSACDNVVIPSAAAILPGAQSREVFGCAHVAMVDHPACFAAALNCLGESD